MIGPPIESCRGALENIKVTRPWRRYIFFFSIIFNPIITNRILYKGKPTLISMVVLYVLDPLIIKELSTKIALVKKLLEYAFPGDEIEQYNINLIGLRKKQNATFPPYEYAFYLSSESYGSVVSHLKLKITEKLPEEIANVLTELVESDKQTIPENALQLIYSVLGENGKLYAKGAEKLEGIMCGFVTEDEYWTKPASQTVQLKKKATGATKLPKFKKLSLDPPATDDKMKFFEESSSEAEDTPSPKLPSDYDLIDENELLGALELSDPLKLASFKCEFDADGMPVKRRKKACKNCTCGLKEMEQQEIEAQRAKTAVKFTSGEITEIDFTVEGDKVGGCGSCALGDAFRCDGCPYLGLPAFKPGERISIGAMGDDL